MTQYGLLNTMASFSVIDGDEGFDLPRVWIPEPKDNDGPTARNIVDPGIECLVALKQIVNGKKSKRPTLDQFRMVIEYYSTENTSDHSET